MKLQALGTELPLETTDDGRPALRCPLHGGLMVLQGFPQVSGETISTEERLTLESPCGCPGDDVLAYYAEQSPMLMQWLKGGEEYKHPSSETVGRSGDTALPAASHLAGGRPENEDRSAEGGDADESRSERIDHIVSPAAPPDLVGGRTIDLGVLSELPGIGGEGNGLGQRAPDINADPPEGATDSEGPSQPGGAFKSQAQNNGNGVGGQLSQWKNVLYFRALNVADKTIAEHQDGRELVANMEFETWLATVRTLRNQPNPQDALTWDPALSETEIQEELESIARALVKKYAPSTSGNGKAAVEEPKWFGTLHRGEPEGEPLKVFDLDSLYKAYDEWAGRPWIWEGILPPSSVALLSGKSESGKSTLIYALVYCVLKGLPFLKRQCRQGRVIYLAGDPVSEMVAAKTFRSLGLTNEEIKVIPGALAVNPTGMAQLRVIVKEFLPALIVGDTLATTVNIDVDKYGQSTYAQQPLVQMARDFGPNFLMSHHSQKSAMDSYGVIDAALGSVGVAAVASTRMSTRCYRRRGNAYYTFAMSNLRVGKPIEGEWVTHLYESGLIELDCLWGKQQNKLDKEAIIKVLERQTEPMSRRELRMRLKPRPDYEQYETLLDELKINGEIEFAELKRRGGGVGIQLCRGK